MARIVKAARSQRSTPVDETPVTTFADVRPGFEAELRRLQRRAFRGNQLVAPSARATGPRGREALRLANIERRRLDRLATDLSLAEFEQLSAAAVRRRRRRRGEILVPFR